MMVPPRPVIRAVFAVRRNLKRLADLLIPAEIALLDFSSGVGGVEVAATMAELGIADTLGDRAMTAAQIAAALGADPDAMHRLLRAAAGYGLCTMDRRTGAVKLSRTGMVLRGDHHASLREWAQYMGRWATVEAWTGLPTSVRTGEGAFATVHRMPVWEWFETHRDEERLFAAAMRQITTLNAAAIARAYPWPPGGVVCDVAGGTGGLLSTIVAESGAELSGVLVEGPGVLPHAQAFVAGRGLLDRIECIEGDIFGGIPATADVFLLKDVLHDWDDMRCGKILATVAASMQQGGKLVLAEITEERNRPNPLAPFVDLQMLTQTDGGRQRSVGELSVLLETAGLRPTGRIFAAAPYDLLEAEKA